MLTITIGIILATVIYQLSPVTRTCIAHSAPRISGTAAALIIAFAPASQAAESMDELRITQPVAYHASCGAANAMVAGKMDKSPGQEMLVVKASQHAKLVVAEAIQAAEEMLQAAYKNGELSWEDIANYALACQPGNS